LFQLYKEIFEGPPWFEKWDVKNVEELFWNECEYKGFQGVCLEKDGKICGFSWGFLLPNVNTEGIYFSDIKKMFENKGLDAEKIFYGAETGIVPILQGEGLGKIIVQERFKLIKRSNVNWVCFRTINPAMIKINQELFQEVIKDFCDPKYPERIWWRVKV
jgi:hypothetical protein